MENLIGTNKDHIS